MAAATGARSGANLLRDARRELARARKETDPEEVILARRQAAEKAWGYVVEEADRLLKVTAPDEAALDERKKKLRELERLAAQPLTADYFELQRELHGNCFYRGLCPRDEVHRLVEKAADYPGRVEAALKQATRRRR